MQLVTNLELECKSSGEQFTRVFFLDCNLQGRPIIQNLGIDQEAEFTKIVSISGSLAHLADSATFDARRAGRTRTSS